VIVFLDTSMLLAACWSTKGLSHALIECGRKESWHLITAEYCVAEVEKNASKYPDGLSRWRRAILPRLEIVGSIYVIDRPIVFETTKDRPVLLSAIGANANYLITSDKADFGHVLGTVVYGVNIRTPKTFLLEMGLVE
jgi:predicted nucleic acid-binding protein